MTTCCTFKSCQWACILVLPSNVQYCREHGQMCYSTEWTFLIFIMINSKIAVCHRRDLNLLFVDLNEC